MELCIARMHSSNKAYGSGFMMLSTNLYAIFVRYIKQGRIRAPPANDLIELSPTFQYGAKTDRRALQSKFKSWAKRMALVDDRLVMANSGKYILPREQCEFVIKQLHLQNEDQHLTFEQVVNKIQERYTWSRKNFGMDWNIVASTIPAICNRESCLTGLQQVCGLQRVGHDSLFQNRSFNSLSESKELKRHSLGQLVNNKYATPPNRRSYVAFPAKYSNPQVVAKLLTSGSFFGESSSADPQKVEFLRNLKLTEADCNKSMKRKRSYSYGELVVPPLIFPSSTNANGSSILKIKEEKKPRHLDFQRSQINSHDLSRSNADLLLKSMSAERGLTSSNLETTLRRLSDASINTTADNQNSSIGIWSPIQPRGTSGCGYPLPLPRPPWLKLPKCQEQIQTNYARIMHQSKNESTRTMAQKYAISSPRLMPRFSTDFSKSNVVSSSPTIPDIRKMVSPYFSITSTPKKPTRRTPTALWRPDPESMDSDEVSIKKEEISPEIAQNAMGSDTLAPSGVISQQAVNECDNNSEVKSSIKEGLERFYYSSPSSFNSEDIEQTSNLIATASVEGGLNIDVDDDDVADDYKELELSHLEGKGNFHDKLEDLWAICNQMQSEFRQFLLSLIVEDEDDTPLQELHRKIDDALRLVRETKLQSDMTPKQPMEDRHAISVKRELNEMSNLYDQEYPHN